MKTQTPIQKYSIHALFLGAVSMAGATLAQGHVQPGVHAGQTAEGKDCHLVAKPTTFENGQKHPLNERIQMKVSPAGAQGLEWTVSHPPLLSVEKSEVGFNHDEFRGFLAQSGGAQALLVRMVHEDDREGPDSYVWIAHDWKNKTSQKVECLGLKFRAPETQ